MQVGGSGSSEEVVDGGRLSAQEIVTGLLTAIESRDLRAVSAALSPDATWQNVPSPPAVGRPDVLSMLARILLWSDEVRWDVMSASYGAAECWLERADRFWIDGNEHTVLCNGVFSVDREAGVVTSVRDYVDLGEWRARMAPVFERLATRPALAVVNRHLDAVRRFDVVAMAADYAPEAVLIRGGTSHRGRFEIIDYFAGVPDRLSGKTLTISDPRELDDRTVVAGWAVSAGSEVLSQGRDNYQVVDGRVIRQEVTITGKDF